MFKDDLKNVFGDFAKAYNTACANSREDYMSNLKPGEKIPAEGKIYTQQARDSFENSCKDLIGRANDILDLRETELNDQISAAPSSDAVNTINMLKMRGNATAEELDVLMTKYKDNVSTYRALKSIAAEQGLYGFKDHPADRQLDQINNLRRTVNKTFNLRSAETGHTENAYLAVIGSMIDSSDL